MDNLEKETIIAIVIAVCIVFGRLTVTFTKMFKKPKIRKFPRNFERVSLSVEQQRAINVGAILAEANHDFCNSLRAKELSVKNQIVGLLEHWWGIDSRESAIEAMEKLQYSGHRSMYSIVLKDAQVLLASGRSIENINQVYNQGAFSLLDYHDYARYIENIKQALPTLKKAGIVRGLSDLAQIDMTAWDMGRLVSVARYSYDCGYISESEAWDYIFFAEKESALQYSNWAEFGKAYIIARAIWGGKKFKLSVMIDVVKSLQSHKDSPWKLVPLK